MTSGTVLPPRRSSAVLALALLVLLPFCRQARADAFDDGMAALHNRDYAAALALWQPLADQGDADAQWNIGVMYEDGEGVKQDYVQAYMWFTLAAKADNDENSLAHQDRSLVAGKMTDKQIAQGMKLAADWKPAASAPVTAPSGAVPEADTGPLAEAKAALAKNDYPAAMKLLKPLADKGDAEALYILGTLFEDGEGVPPDDTAAASWYLKAADEGDAPAETALADLYSAGRGVAQDNAEAAKWYRKAAEQDDAPAEFSLAELYTSGKGVAQSDTEAAKWYRKAAEQGDAVAQDFVADKYEYGRGEPQDLVQAYMWFSLANAGEEDPDYKVAAEALGRLAAEMTPDQITEAKRLAAAWKPAGGDTKQ